MEQLKAKDGCCEEASVLSHNFYIPCNAPAEKLMYSKSEDKTYRMCFPCADHNKRRGFVEIGDYVNENKEKTVVVSSSVPAVSNTAPIVYDINPAIIAELKTEQDAILASLPENIADLDIEIIKKAKRKSVKLRTATEAQRKEYKAWVLSYGKLVDSKAADAIEPVLEIENIYTNLINDYDEYFAELSRIAAEKEAKRIADIKYKIEGYRLLSGITPNYSSNELKTHIEELQKYLTCDFDFQEFAEEMEGVYKDVENILKTALENRLKFEAEQEKLEAQRKIDDENRAKFEAEKAEFEAKQAEANAAIEAERAALQKQRDDAERAEMAKIQAEQEKQRQAEIQKQRDELEREKQAQAEKRKLLEEQESARLEQIRIENEARRIAQAKEDKIRNAAPQLYTALELLLKCDLHTNLPEGCDYELTEAMDAYAAAGGDLNSLGLGD